MCEIMVSRNNDFEFCVYISFQHGYDDLVFCLTADFGEVAGVDEDVCFGKGVSVGFVDEGRRVGGFGVCVFGGVDCAGAVGVL